jgi:hypothetical protein
MTFLGSIHLPRLSKILYPRYNEGKGKSISLRLDRIVLDTLRQEASQKGITLNRLVSQTIKERVDWYSNAARAGFIPVRRKLIVTLIEKFSEEEICSLAEYIAKTDTKDCVLLLRSEYNIEAAIDVLETWVRISGYAFRHKVHDTRHSYVIEHDMSKKWSLYLAELFKNILAQFNLKGIGIDITENSLAFSLDIDK